MIASAWEVVIANHQSALNTCKNLIKEGRLLPAISILKLADKNISSLQVNRNVEKQ